MGDKFVKSSEDVKILDIDNNNLYATSMSQSLPYTGITSNRSQSHPRIPKHVLETDDYS